MHFALTLKVYRTFVQFCIEINWQWVTLDMHFALTLKVNQTGTIPCSCYLLIKNTQKVKPVSYTHLTLPTTAEV